MEDLIQNEIVGLRISVMPGTYLVIGKEAIAQMKQQMLFINTSRGELTNTKTDNKK
ncbi:MAG TPA: NAD(P)-dependent oxidoreductase [Candidatus Omnitrophota bacterium]|nr:NAD(P)-dependent oxidoreductase [Candidatus Omnitrophota bacterium]HPD84871.1 NAD(P)-dependent oxidoreductase [Candidatus Omnitrophota bacterium]HRZ03729.1 NAD(P)-dependent oxidoreductase [Candidatus Omnitrophota bacterium]